MSRTPRGVGGTATDGRLPIRFEGGVNNRSQSTKIGEGYVAVAENVDIDKDGVPTRRDGYACVNALLGAHSLWSHDLLSYGLVADRNTLYKVATDGSTTVLVTGLNGTELSYAMIGRHVRWSNGVQTGQLDLMGNPAPLGVETPLPSFVVQALSNGGMAAGRYGVTMTFADAKREESGAPDTVFVDVPDGGGIKVMNVPPALEGIAVEARIYITGANGTELFYASSTLPGAPSFAIAAGMLGRPLTTQFCDPFPPATHLFAKGGRLFGAVGRVLVWSEPVYYGLYRPTTNMVPLPDDITMIAAPDTQAFILYVGTKDKTFVLRGDSINEAEISSANAAGVISGSMVMAPHEVLRLDRVLSAVPVWAGADGVPYAGTEMGVMPLSDKFVYPIYDKAAAALVQLDGRNRYILSGRGGSPSPLAVSDVVTATVTENTSPQ